MYRDSIPVIWGADEKYILPAFVVMKSILMNSYHKFHFYIVTCDNIKEQVQEYSELLKHEFNNFEVNVLMVNNEIFSEAKIKNKHLSVAAYFRLLIPKLLYDVSKCIYLDCDILVNGDLAEIYEIDLEDNYLAGVKDCHIIENTVREYEHEKLLGIPRDKYINSGVLLMNLTKMREDLLVDKFLNDISNDNWYEDQDILNKFCYPKIKILPLKFNLFHFYYGPSIRFLYNLSYETDDFEFDEPFILHMGGIWKPWYSRKVKWADRWWKIATVYKSTEYYHRYDIISRQTCTCGEDIFFKSLYKSIYRDKKYVIWGYSKNGKNLYDMLMIKGYTNVVAFVDNDKEKLGKEYNGIPVMNIEQVIIKYKEIIWCISVQAAYEEVRQQLLELGISENDIVRYVNYYDDRAYLLALDEHFYESEIDKICEYMYVDEFADYEQRKRHLVKILKEPERYPEEYWYLNDRYHFEYWYNAKLKC